MFIRGKIIGLLSANIGVHNTLSAPTGRILGVQLHPLHPRFLRLCCTAKADAVQRKDYTMKYELLIGGIHFMCIFVVDCVACQTGLQACSFSFYDNLFPFLFKMGVINSIFERMLL